MDRHPSSERAGRELIFITGLSGSGKGTALRALEDIGYYAVDNLPVELIPKFLELIAESPSIRHAALIVDIRERDGLLRFPDLFEEARQRLPSSLLFLEADENVLISRYSETRRPHPLGTEDSVTSNLAAEKALLAPIREIATWTINTTKFNVHELRDVVVEKVSGERSGPVIRIAVNSFGFKHGLPQDSDLVFDVRFLPNPNYQPELKERTGRDPEVAEYILGYPQSGEFLKRIADMLIYLLPHYVEEGKSYLTIAFGCTGGRHRSVMMAENIASQLRLKGYRVKTNHRDLARSDR